MTEEALYEQRLRKSQELRARGADPYANDFTVDTPIAEFVRRYGGEASAEKLAAVDARHAMAGRVMAVNVFGKACFLRIQDGSSDERGPDGEPVGRLQLFLQKNRLGEKFELLK